MKKCLLIPILSLVLAIVWGGEGFAQTKKEMTFNSTTYFSGTSKSFQMDPDRSIRQPDILGWKFNDNNDGPFHGTQIHVVGVLYNSKDYRGFRGYGTWVDKDGDKVIWELLDTPLVLPVPRRNSLRGPASIRDGKVLWNIPCSI